MNERRTVMKKKIFFSFLGVMLLLIPGALWAGNQPGVSQDTPAILASLGQANAIPLDDAAAAAVRGQALYVLVKVFGLNMFDGGAGVQWTWNPLGYRYGNWGGPNWTAQGDPVDPMDTFFQKHDGGTLNDQGLVGALASLATTPNTTWGLIYDPSPWPEGAPSNVSVFGISLIGGKVFRGWKDMPYTEYSRREAMFGMQLLNLGSRFLK
jgi:hypothetical protein